jgi:flagella basal body P-ring formation protein FlgA
MIELLAFVIVAADTRALVSSALAREFALEVAAEDIALEPGVSKDLPEAAGLALRRWGLRLNRGTRSYSWGRVPDLRFQLPDIAPLFLLKTALPKGTTIRSEHVEARKEAWDPARLSAKFRAIGQETRRALPKGHRLSPADTWPPYLVHRGDRLQAYRLSSRAVLRFPVISMRNGLLGEMILVREPGGSQLKTAVIRAAGLVELP